MSLSQLDRRIGAAVRRGVARAPGGRRAAGVAAGALSPAFRAAVAVMLLRAGHRRAGVDALSAGVVAAMGARLLRDRLSRPRPGGRAGGGFPSRHGAAAVAIARAAWRREPRLGRALAGAAAVGLAGRVASAQHDPADVLAGAALGLAAEQLVHVVCLDQYLGLRC